MQLELIFVEKKKMNKHDMKPESVRQKRKQVNQIEICDTLLRVDIINKMNIITF